MPLSAPPAPTDRPSAPPLVAVVPGTRARPAPVRRAVATVPPATHRPEAPRREWRRGAAVPPCCANRALYYL